MTEPLSHATVEGALARVVGLELHENPYDALNACARHEAWKWAWRYADALLAFHLEHEVPRHNEDEAA